MTLSPKDTSSSSHTGEVCPDCICGIFLLLNILIVYSKIPCLWENNTCPHQRLIFLTAGFQDHVQKYLLCFIQDPWGSEVPALLLVTVPRGWGILRDILGSLKHGTSLICPLFILYTSNFSASSFLSQPNARGFFEKNF